MKFDAKTDAFIEHFVRTGACALVFQDFSTAPSVYGFKTKADAELFLEVKHKENPVTISSIMTKEGVTRFHPRGVEKRVKEQNRS